MFQIRHKKTGEIRTVVWLLPEGNLGSMIRFLTYDRIHQIWCYVPGNEWALFEPENE